MFRLNQNHCSDWAGICTAYYLASHSIELSLKAYLLARGVPLIKLRSGELGHDLCGLLELAIKKKLGRIIKLSDSEQHWIQMLGEHHVTHRFRYIEEGKFLVPNWINVVIISEKLARGMIQLCYRSSFNREEYLKKYR